MVTAEIENSVSYVQEVRIKNIEGIYDGIPPSDVLVKSIKAKGVINLPTVRPFINRAGYEVVDGRRRLWALAIIGEKYAEVVVNPRVDSAGSASLVSNYLRSDNFLQAAREIWERMDNSETEKEIADEEGVSLATIRALRDMRNLIPELIGFIEHGEMGHWAARMAARQSSLIQAELAKEGHEKGRVTSDMVKAKQAIRRSEALTEVVDLFDDLPENEYPDPEPLGIVDDRTMEQKNRDAGQKVKISRQDRLSNIKHLVYQAKQEALAIKSNSRSDDENAILTFLNEILDRLEDPR